MNKLVIDGLEIDPGLVTLLVSSQKKINNNNYKDRDGGVRGWQLETPFRGQKNLFKDLYEFVESADEYQKPVSENPYDHVSVDEVLNQGADVVCRVMFLLDQLGLGIRDE
jgi:hypothetical protein